MQSHLLHEYCICGFMEKCLYVIYSKTLILFSLYILVTQKPSAVARFMDMYNI